MNALDTLKAMRELLVDPSRWAKFNRARNARGYSVEPTSRDACQWCLVGAHAKVTGFKSDQADDYYENFRESPMGRLLHKASGIHDFYAWSFNDRSTHPEVITLLDDAIVLASESGKVLRS